MTTLISLIGEQPMPVLLPARRVQAEHNLLIHTALTQGVAERLARLLPNSRLEAVEPYDLEKIYDRFGQMAPRAGALVNPTSGTKLMSYAALLWAGDHQLPFLYFESEGRESRLQHYRFEGNRPALVEKETLPPLITAADYLNAHLPGFRATGFSRDGDGGGEFEAAVFAALDPHFELLCGVKPQGVADQIEIDLVIRAGNLAAIAEIKLGGGDSPKVGIDQLATAGGREYLGTYTAKFLITGRPPRRAIMTLAQQRGVHVIALPGYRRGRPLAAGDRDHLVQQVQQYLSPARRTGAQKP